MHLRGLVLPVVVLAAMTAAPVRSNVIDYSTGYTISTARCFDINGVGQAFVPSQAYVSDASLFVIKRWSSSKTRFCSQPWWPDARLEIRSGMPGAFDGTGGNLLFRSNPIDFDALPTAAVIPVAGDTMYIGEVRASDLGLTDPVAVAPNTGYSLLLVNYGDCASTIQYPMFRGNVYWGGGALIHNCSGGAWNGPPDTTDIPFRVTTGSPPDPVLISSQANTLEYGAIADGSGGAMIFWGEGRGVVGQRVDGMCNPLWGPDGTVVGQTDGYYSYPDAAPDGAGGGYVVWVKDNLGTGSDLYAQRVSAAGTPLWAASGAPVCVAAESQADFSVAPDGFGGLMVAFASLGADYVGPIGAQRLGANGSPAPGWPANGVTVCAAPQGQDSPRLAPDGAGGAIVVWEDFRNGNAATRTNGDVYARRVTASGTSGGWPANGVAICTNTAGQAWPAITADGAGGAFMAWDDVRGGSTDVYAQRIDGLGTTQWTANGVSVCGAPGSQSVFNAEFRPTLVVPDGAGGAHITWADGRGDGGIYAMRLTSAGAPSPGWMFDGTPVCDVSGYQASPTSIPDGKGGFIVAWSDTRVSSVTRVYAQRIDAHGTMRWGSGGVMIGTGNDPMLVTDGAAGAFVVWQGSFSGLYVQRIDSSGVVHPQVVDVPLAGVEANDLGRPYPNPARSSVSLSLDLPGATTVSARVFDVSGRRVRTLLEPERVSPGRRQIQWDGRTEAGEPAPAGVYLLQVTSDNRTRTRRVVLMR